VDRLPTSTEDVLLDFITAKWTAKCLRSPPCNLTGTYPRILAILSLLAEPCVPNTAPTIIHTHAHVFTFKPESTMVNSFPPGHTSATAQADLASTDQNESTSHTHAFPFVHPSPALSRDHAMLSANSFNVTFLALSSNFLYVGPFIRPISGHVIGAGVV
jgi:hypothetical protein